MQALAAPARAPVARRLIPLAPADIHIFWWQACGETLGKQAKSLIQKQISPVRERATKNRQRQPPASARPARRDIHIFWWQACGEALGKRLKPLIFNNFSILQQGLANTRKSRCQAAVAR